MFPNFHHSTQFGFYLIIAICIFFWILSLFLSFGRRRGRVKKYHPAPKENSSAADKHRPFVSPREQSRPVQSRNDKLDAYLDFLIRKSWDGRSRNGFLEFSQSDAEKINDLSEFLHAVLKHLRRIAPELDIPHLKPRVKFETLLMCAGQFAEHDGWITISIDDRYLLEPRAAKAIMCHEICHYILNFNGIRYQQFLENEHLTEAAMFAFGLGEVFFAGYRFVSNDGKEHGVGYLEPSEYRHLRARAAESWKTYVGSDHGHDLEKTFKARIPDPRTRDRLLEAETKKHPHRSRLENIQSILEQLERDRR